MGDYRDYSQQDDSQKEEGDVQFVGVNERLDPDKLPPGYMARAVNSRMRTGAPTTRRGVIKPAWVNAVGAGVKISPSSMLGGAARFRDPNGVEWVLLVADGTVYRCREHNFRAPLSLPTGVVLTGNCVPVPAFDRVYLFRGRYLQPLVMTSLDTGFTDLVPRWSAATVYNAYVQVTGQPFDEMAYGPWKTVSSMTSSGGVATVVTSSDHGYVTGADITIRGANQAVYNGRWSITVVDSTTFTFAFPGGTSPATGTITCSNMSYYWHALGTTATITNVTRIGGGPYTATVTAANAFTPGQYVTITGLTGAGYTGYNGTWLIASASGTQFTFSSPVDPGAGGAISGTCRTSVVLAGHDPDTYPAEWARSWNILPNANDAVFAGNRLWVPTAYTPGANGYDSTSAYTKVDFLVAMDIGDNLHFYFSNELRINQGDSSEIVSVMKYANDTLVVLKGSSWGILTGLSSDTAGDLRAVALDMRGDSYGCCAPRSAVVAGRDVLFPSVQRGISSLTQNELGQVRSSDTPFTNDMDNVIRRINWLAASKIRIAWWEDRLYAAVPLDGSAVNNAILVYDYRRGNSITAQGAWDGYDMGTAICPKEWFKATYNGRERLFFLGEDNYVSMMEESDCGDQIPASPSANGLGWEPIVTCWRTRGYFATIDQDKFKAVDVTLWVNDANFSISANTGVYGQVKAVRSNVSFNRTRYLRPVGKADYVEGNANGDFLAAGRGNYSVRLLPLGIYPGHQLGIFTEVTARTSLRPLLGRYVQFEINNTNGSAMLRGVWPSVSDGMRHEGLFL